MPLGKVLSRTSIMLLHPLMDSVRVYAYALCNRAYVTHELEERSTTPCDTADLRCT